MARKWTTSSSRTTTFGHDIDYPCFLLCRWDQSTGRENRLQVFGPTLTDQITERLIGECGAFTHDWQARVGHPLSQRVYRNRGGTVLPRPGPSVEAKDVGSGLVFTGSDWVVRAAPAEHVQPFLERCSLRFARERQNQSGSGVCGSRRLFRPVVRSR